MIEKDNSYRDTNITIISAYNIIIFLLHGAYQAIKFNAVWHTNKRNHEQFTCLYR